MTYIDIIYDGPSDSGKSSRWKVHAKDGDVLLGEIRWFGRWRCYAFFPRSETLFEKRCLREIADHCDRESHAQLSRSAKSRRAADSLKENET